MRGEHNFPTLRAKVVVHGLSHHKVLKFSMEGGLVYCLYGLSVLPVVEHSTKGTLCFVSI